MRARAHSQDITSKIDLGSADRQAVMEENELLRTKLGEVAKQIEGFGELVRSCPLARPRGGGGGQRVPSARSPTERCGM